MFLTNLCHDKVVAFGAHHSYQSHGREFRTHSVLTDLCSEHVSRLVKQEHGTNNRISQLDMTTAVKIVDQARYIGVQNLGTLNQTLWLNQSFRGSEHDNTAIY